MIKTSPKLLCSNKTSVQFTKILYKNGQDILDIQCIKFADLSLVGELGVDVLMGLRLLKININYY